MRQLFHFEEWFVFCARENLPWCVVVARLGQEKRAQAELAMAGWATYLPMERVKVKKGGDRKAANRPLFARYFFAACREGGDAAAARNIPEIVSIQRSEGGRSVVSLPVLCRLMLTELRHGFDETYERPRSKKKGLVCGQPVKVRGGVLGSFEVTGGYDALILKVLSEREVVAQFSLFGRVGEAIFQTADLEPVEDVAAAA